MTAGNSKTSALTNAMVGYRILLAAIGGFLFTLIVTVFTPELLVWLWGWNKASSLMWMMLLSFAVYCALIMWIIATKKLLKITLILLILGGAMSFGFVQLQSQNMAQNTQSEVSQ
ncbi:hypothetical protein [Idiomarina sp. HP20-50]|uniref:hypothetical protein n=1 Tax=Idiomarina sp. HP20-50 TaxID=3070813 RepID=UPI00294B6F0C|nr:hypothetical protein [Idiomarina sp. HP20-50]MDV6314828.1 hypothetical protein [Idiomarina sp. HP20-50]